VVSLGTYPIIFLMLAANDCFRHFRSSHTSNVCCGAACEKQPFSLSLSAYWDRFLKKGLCGGGRWSRGEGPTEDRQAALTAE
jgi:hypothetical protein